MESPHKTLPTCQLLPTLKLSSPSLSRPFTESMSATKSTFIGCFVFSLSCFKPNGFLSRRFDKANFGSLLIESYVNIMGPMCRNISKKIPNPKQTFAFGICCIWCRSVTNIGAGSTTCCCGLGFRKLQNIGTTRVLVTADL